MTRFKISRNKQNGEASHQNHRRLERFLSCLVIVGQAALIQHLAVNGNRWHFGCLGATTSFARNSNRTSDRSSLADTVALEQDKKPAPAPAHFFCLCPTRSNECNEEICDTIITYKDPSNAPLDLPNSTWTTARNVMYHMAKRMRFLAQLSGRAPESHYCFLDGDCKLSQSKKYIQDRLANEKELDRVIFPNYNGYFKGVKYAFGGDANFNCFSSASMDDYLPYSTVHDDQAWYLSQTELIFRASTIRAFAFKLYSDIIVRNPFHNNNYPRDGLGVSNSLHSRVVEGFHGCHPMGHKIPSGNKLNCSYQGQWLYDAEFNATHVVFAR